MRASSLLSVAGYVVFYLSLLSLLPGATPNGSFFRVAGWLITGGWILQRWEANQWPFKGPVIRDVMWAVTHVAKSVLASLLYLMAMTAGSLLCAALILTSLMLLSMLTRSHWHR
jgi:hypothetical protein